MSDESQNERAREFRIGLFVLVSVAIVAAVIFAIGARSALLTRKSYYYTIFPNVEGLRSGSPVRLSGIDVGTVSQVRFEADGRCRVDFSVSREQASLISTGTHASIGAKGLLGDKLIELVPGEGTPIPEGGSVALGRAGGMAGAMASAGDMIDSARPAIANVQRFTETLADDAFRHDLQTLSHNLAELTGILTHSDGTIPRLLRDPAMAEEFSTTLHNARIATGEVAELSRNLSTLSREVTHGDGTAHELIYGDSGRQMLTNLSRTSEQLALILHDIREGNGNAHQLVYGDGRLAQNLENLSDNLRQVTDDVRRGRGTIGALMTDPSLFEDMKRLVGNLERNEVLRALVRYSIRRDEQQQTTTVSE